MPHDVFITHSSKDRKTADAVHAALEQAGIACWYAPEDIRGGSSWSAAIMDGIANSRVMILLLSKNSNESRHVTREIQVAFKRDIIVIPFRIDDVEPTKELEYFLESVHILNAFTPPLEDNLTRLVEHVQTFLAAEMEAQAAEDQERARLDVERKKEQELERERGEAEAARKRTEEQEQARREAERKKAQEERQRVETEAARKRAEEQEQARRETERKKAQEVEQQQHSRIASKATGPGSAIVLESLTGSTSSDVSGLSESAVSLSGQDASSDPFSLPESGDSLWHRLKQQIGAPGLALLTAGGLILLVVSGWLLLKRSPVRNGQDSAAQSTSLTTQAGTQTNSSAPAATPSKKSFSGEFDVGKALELIFGTYDYQKKAVTWRLTKDVIKASPISVDAVPQFVGTVYTAALFVRSFQQDGIQRRIVIMYTTPGPRFDCHACAPIIGGAAFSQQGDMWQLDAESRLISPIGSNGQPGDEAKLIQIGPQQYGLLFETLYGTTGEDTESVLIIGDVQGTMGVLFDFPDFGGNNKASACVPEEGTCFAYSSTMIFEAGANPDYHDIKVITKGSKPDKTGKVRPINQVRTFRLTKDRYVPV